MGCDCNNTSSNQKVERMPARIAGLKSKIEDPVEIKKLTIHKKAESESVPGIVMTG